MKRYAEDAIDGFISPADDGEWVRHEDALAAIEQAVLQRQTDIVEMLREQAREEATNAVCPDALDADVAYAHRHTASCLRKLVDRIERGEHEVEGVSEDV